MLGVYVSLWLAACGGGGGGKPSLDVVEGPDLREADSLLPDDLTADDVTVETEVSSNVVDAGGSVVVNCMVLGPSGPLKLPVDVHVRFDGLSKVVPEGTLVLEEPGEYEIWCAIRGADIRDETPEIVTANITGITQVLTEVEPATIPAGATAVVRCTASNDQGQTQPWNKGVRATPEDGLVIEGQNVKGVLAGEYAVQCKGPVTAEITTAILTVVPGQGKRFEASVNPASIRVDEVAQVGCLVLDAEGNETVDAWKVDAPTELVVTGSSLTTTKAGKYKVKCAPVEPKGGEALVAADLTVRAGDPVGMALYLKPAKAFFTVQEQVTVIHNLLDQYGNEGEEAAIHPIVVTPGAGLETTAGKLDRFIFSANGVYQLEVQAVDYPWGGTLTVICDGSGPKVTVTYPPRAANMTGSTQVTVTGFVKDETSEVASLKVNGQPVALDAGGNFAYPMTLGHGMSVVNIEALDNWGNLGRGVRSVFYSTRWHPADMLQPLAALIPDTLHLWLSQEFIDDGDHSLPPDDLATLLETVAGGMDLSSVLPEGGMALGNQCSLEIEGIQYGTPSVQLTSLDEALRAVVSIPNLVVDVNIVCCYQVPIIGEYCDSYYGSVLIDKVKLDVFIFISADGTGDVDVALGPITADIVGMEVDIQGLIGPLFDPMVTLLVNTLKDAAINQLQEQFGAELPQMIDDAVADLYNGMMVDFPSLLGEGDPLPLMLNVVIRELRTAFAGIMVRIDLAVTAMKGIVHNPVGVLLRDGCMGAEPTPYALVRDNEVNLGVSVDMVNELLFTLWYGGALNLDVTEEALGDVDLAGYGITNLLAQVDMLYAPFIQSCGTDGALLLQLGDTFLHAVFDMMGQHWDMDIYLFLEADVMLNLIEEDGVTKIGISVGELKTSLIEVVRVGDDLKGREKMVDDLFSGVVIPLLMDQVLGELGSFDLPEIDLHSLSDALPEGSLIGVGLQKLQLTNGYLEIGGKLQ
jgi:hypothetical protein